MVKAVPQAAHQHRLGRRIETGREGEARFLRRVRRRHRVQVLDGVAKRSPDQRAAIATGIRLQPSQLGREDTVTRVVPGQLCGKLLFARRWRLLLVIRSAAPRPRNDFSTATRRNRRRGARIFGSIAFL